MKALIDWKEKCGVVLTKSSYNNSKDIGCLSYKRLVYQVMVTFRIRHPCQTDDRKKFVSCFCEYQPCTQIMILSFL